MTNAERLVLTLAIIFVSLCLGYWCRILTEKGSLSLSAPQLLTLRKRLQTFAIFGLLPFSAMLSLWGLPKPDSGLIALPLLGIASYIWGGALALFLARLLKMDRAKTGSFYCCGTFTNLGAVGALVCLVFLGENTIALVALYRLFEEIYYFSVSYPIAGWYGQKNSGATLSFRDFKFSPVLAVILAALGLGITLNLLGVPRPEPLGIVASAAMLTATVFFLFSIGLSLKLSRMLCYWQAGLAICAIKFIGAPLAIIAIAGGMGYGTYNDGLALKVVAILSAMPVAMTALVPPTLFDLDVDLANACWIFSTLGLIGVLPALLLLLPPL